MTIDRLLLSATFGVTATASLALPVQWSVADGGNDHWYEYVHDWGTTWSDAAADAASRSYMGAAGYLVTLTSAAENAFVRQLANDQHPWGGSNNFHIGFSDTAIFGAPGAWEWAAGPEAGSSAAVTYTNWQNGLEPGPWAGDYAMMDTSGTWFATNGYGHPYVVEYSLESVVPPVPLPGSLPLLVAAFVGFGVARRRRA